MNGCVVFFLDADNLNDAAAVREALVEFESLFGKSSIRRAYGSASSLKVLQDVLAELAIRPCTNFTIEKNTTDVALAVDAMEIACASSPSAFAIGSGDADFFPLAVKLREKGVKTVGFSLDGKMSAETAVAYDSVILVGAHRRLAQARHVDSPAASARQPAKTPSAQSDRQVQRMLDAAHDADALRRIFEAVPKLLSAAPVHISEVAKGLHDAQLLGKNGSSSKYLSKFTGFFELTPTRQPNHARWTGKQPR